MNRREDPNPEHGPDASRDGEWSVDPDLVAERIGSDIVVVHLRTNKIYELNPTAARVFELIRGGAGREAVEAALLAEYAVDRGHLAASVDRLLGELRTAGLLR